MVESGQFGGLRIWNKKLKKGEIVLLHGKTPSSRPKIALYILLKKVALSPSFIKRRGWTVSNQPSPVKNLCIKRIVFRVVVLTGAARA